jgi:hypothetical protein
MITQRVPAASDYAPTSVDGVVVVLNDAKVPLGYYKLHKQNGGDPADPANWTMLEVNEDGTPLGSVSVTPNNPVTLDKFPRVLYGGSLLGALGTVLLLLAKRRRLKQAGKFD